MGSLGGVQPPPGEGTAATHQADTAAQGRRQRGLRASLLRACLVIVAAAVVVTLLQVLWLAMVGVNRGTLLHIAAAHNHTAACGLLLEAGADVDARDAVSGTWGVCVGLPASMGT